MIKAKSVHIIGVGGIGTSAVAKWWSAQGAAVSGSDMHSSELIDELKKYKIKTKIGHFADNVPDDCDLVIYSVAVPETNVERLAAAERGIPEWSFPEFLGRMSQEKKTIAVSGTNGKSTTTAMIATIMIAAGLDPTVIIGTQVPGWKDKNLRIGESDWFVVEACEHLANMLHIKPYLAVITNIAEDHLDYYRDIDHIRSTFQEWIDCKDTCSEVVINKEDPESMKLNAKYATYFAIENRLVKDGKQTFDVAGVEFSLKIPGKFNAQNAAAAIAVANILGIDDEVKQKALAEFSGTWRRFEHVGSWHEADLYSDYAHHPTAIAASLRAFREFYPDRRLVLCFEPHQRSRTKELFDDFVKSFDQADALVISEIYEVEGRNEEETISSFDLVEKVKSRGKINKVEYAKDHQEAESKLGDIVEKGDVVIIMGAGPIDNLARKLV